MTPDNPPAFPDGMRLLDYFAAAALTGYRADTSYSHIASSDIAEWAFRDAQAMLAERARVLAERGTE